MDSGTIARRNVGDIVFDLVPLLLYINCYNVTEQPGAHVKANIITSKQPAYIDLYLCYQINVEMVPSSLAGEAQPCLTNTCCELAVLGVKGQPLNGC